VLHEHVNPPTVFVQTWAHVLSEMDAHSFTSVEKQGGETELHCHEIHSEGVVTLLDSPVVKQILTFSPTSILILDDVIDIVKLLNV